MVLCLYPLCTAQFKIGAVHFFAATHTGVLASRSPNAFLTVHNITWQPQSGQDQLHLIELCLTETLHQGYNSRVSAGRRCSSWLHYSSESLAASLPPHDTVQEDLFANCQIGLCSSLQCSIHSVSHCPAACWYSEQTVHSFLSSIIQVSHTQQSCLQTVALRERG